MKTTFECWRSEFMICVVGCLTSIIIIDIEYREAHKTTLVTNFYLIVDHSNTNNTPTIVWWSMCQSISIETGSRGIICPIYQYFYMVIIIIIFECLCLLFGVWFIFDIMLPITSHFIHRTAAPRKQRVVKTIIINYGINSTSP
jgi:hypothetical protein